MRATRTLLFLVLAGLSGTAISQEISIEDSIRNPAMGNYKAYAEFKMAHYESARHIWQTLAGLGNPDALFNLGILAEDGLGQPRDMEKAEAFYLAGANAGGFKAQYRLGLLYSDGTAIRKDLDKARRYLAMAAEQGDQDAAARLAALDNPDRPLNDFAQAELLASRGKHADAVAIYQRLADTGNGSARTRLAWMYEVGRGVPQNLDMAARLFMDSAAAGDAEAQYAIAVMYRTGKGQAQDREQSLNWLKRSAAQHYPAAVAALAAEATNR